MARIGFIGLGNMGGPMAVNLVEAGHDVCGFDVSPSALAQAQSHGLRVADTISACAAGCEVVITMLPAGPQVRQAYLGGDGILSALNPGALLIDCSTIDVETAREVAQASHQAGFAMLDAPVSGGVGGAQGGTLTFMVGGEAEDLARARPYLEVMGQTIVHTGGAGNGQAAKICNNMILGISMIAVSEAFSLAEKLGLEAQKLFDVASRSSGQCWSLTTYCPVAGPVPTSPANRDYKAGFTVAMMEKDLKLAQQAAKSVDCMTPLGAEASNLYALFAEKGNAGVDFSAIIKMIGGNEL